MRFVELAGARRVGEDATSLGLRFAGRISRIWVKGMLRNIVLYYPSSPIALGMGELKRPNRRREPKVSAY
jgi:hypothetical protein